MKQTKYYTCWEVAVLFADVDTEVYSDRRSLKE